MPELLLQLPGFRLLALCAGVLTVKMFAMAFYTGYVRIGLNVRLNEEDRERAQTTLVPQEPPEVERVLRAHRNDLENIPAFLLLALLAVLSGAAPQVVRGSMEVFTLARLAHSFFYLRRLQPWRTLSWSLGMGASLVLVGVLLARALG